MTRSKPNILFIVLDTLRRDRLSIYGHQHITSPELDAFSEHTTLFERAVAPAQWTIPSHASMFTGLYPTTHQLTQADRTLSGSYPTIAEILQVAGYHTAGFCNNPLVGVLENGLQRGFTEFYNYAGAAPNRPHDVHKSSVRKIVSRRWRRFARRVSQRFALSDRLFRASLHPLLTPLWTRYINYKGNTAHSIDDLTAYLSHRRQTEPDTPNFTFLNLMGAHLPYRPPEDVLRRFAPDFTRADYKIMANFNADAARWASPDDPPTPDYERQIIDRFYDAEVAHQDYHLGRLLRWLKQSGALKDTMVIITADHGEGHGDHDFFGHSFVVYQELVHVPLMIAYPQAFPAGKRVSKNVSTRRLFHTILEAADVQPPLAHNDPNAAVERLSLARSLNGHPDPERGLVFTEAIPPKTLVALLEHRNPSVIERMNLRNVRRGVYLDDHKMALVGDQVEGLFDIQSDPAEVKNTATQQANLATNLQAHVNEFVAFSIAHRADSVASGNGVSDDVLENLRALGYVE